MTLFTVDHESLASQSSLSKQGADKSTGKNNSQPHLGRTQGTYLADQNRPMVPTRTCTHVHMSGGWKGWKTTATNPQGSRLGVGVSLGTIFPLAALTLWIKKLGLKEAQRASQTVTQAAMSPVIPSV